GSIIECFAGRGKPSRTTLMLRVPRAPGRDRDIFPRNSMITMTLYSPHRSGIIVRLNLIILILWSLFGCAHPANPQLGTPKAPLAPPASAPAPSPLSVSPAPPRIEEIPLAKMGGVYQLPAEINGVLTLNFVLDSGASEVFIPADVVLTLLRTGTIQD